MAKSQWKKPYKIKRKKPIFKNRFFFPIISVLIILAGFFYLLVFSPLFQIKDVIISGNQKIQTSELKDSVDKETETKIIFLKTRSLFLAREKRIAEYILKNYPQIGLTEIKKEYPGALSVIVKERGPVAIFSQNENLFYIDEEGIAFEQFFQPDDQKIKIINAADVSEIKPGNRAIEKNLLSEILKIKDEFDRQLKIKPVEAIIISEQRLNIKTAEAWEAYFNLKGDLDWQIKELGVIIQNKIDPQKRTNLEYIDLRFDRVFVSPQGLLKN